MPLYIGDYLSDTQHLSAAESGGYLHLLMHSWRSGPLPSNQHALRRIARIEEDEWESAWLILQLFFEQQEDGTWIQGRLEKERTGWEAKRESASKKASNAAK
jgi:uncharacterized protein YdaU (DUF1376 family)